MASFGKGVEYALHCLLYVANPPAARGVTVADMAQFQGVSETYLAKVFTKLRKAGIVRSALGAQGGYELARAAEDITFWDVVIAVEGDVRLFECWNIRAQAAPYQDPQSRPDWSQRGPCTIHQVMMDADALLQAFLKTKTLAWLRQEIDQKLPLQERQQVIQWFS